MATPTLGSESGQVSAWKKGKAKRARLPHWKPRAHAQQPHYAFTPPARPDEQPDEEPELSDASDAGEDMDI